MTHCTVRLESCLTESAYLHVAAREVWHNSLYFGWDCLVNLFGIIRGMLVRPLEKCSRYIRYFLFFIF